MQGAIYKKRGLLTAGGKEIKNKEKLFQLLEAVWELSRVTAMHCRGHQRGTGYVSRGNCLVGQTPRRAAEELSSPEVLVQTAKLLLAPGAACHSKLYQGGRTICKR
jgi:hypothetical protein